MANRLATHESEWLRPSGSATSQAEQELARAGGRNRARNRQQFFAGRSAVLQDHRVGKKCLEKGEYLPFDAGHYMERLGKEIPKIDPVIELYLVESLKCFRYGTFVASAVMVGVAAEHLMLLLRKAIHDSLNSAEKKKRFDDDAQGQSKRVYAAVWKKLNPLREQMPDNLRGSLQVELDGIFGLVRKTRNEAGHPTGRKIEREEAEALLLLFPTHAKTVFAVIEWLASQHI